MNTKIIIIGGGISGLTCAHELVEKGFSVILIEKDSILGGVAKSRRDINGIPSENSLRVYAPYYNNIFDIMKRIPLADNINLSVYDNLTPMSYHTITDKINPNPNENENFTFIENFWIYYFLFKYLCSNRRRDEYHKIKITDIFKNKISSKKYKIERYNESYANYFKNISISILDLPSYNHNHNYINNIKIEYSTNSYSDWFMMNEPTNEAWFNHWEKYLVKKGVSIYKNTELIKFDISNNKIIGCLLNNNYILNADEYILSINPFNAENVLKNSGEKIKNLYNQHYLLNKNTDSRQISFRLGFNKKIKLNNKNTIFLLPDSEFNISVYSQENFWKENIKLDNSGNIKSLWSGGVVESYRVSTLYNKPGTSLSKEELMNEIIYQILRSESLQELIFANNNFYLYKSDIFYTEIWHEWEQNSKTHELEQINKKWSSNIYNEKFRPNQNTSFSNLYINGPHTKTSISYTSMEGSVESGKIISNLIFDKYNLPKTYLYSHEDPDYLNIFKSIDDLLYKFKLPNIIDIIIFILLVLVIYFVIKKIIKI